jgi:3-O-methylgallate 3,4-dioxygenase
MLNMPPEDWPRYEALERAGELALWNHQGDRVAFDALLAAADPRVAAYMRLDERTRRHARNEAAIEHLGAVLEKARLDALIVVGDDQMEMFDENNLPTTSIYYGATIRNAPFHGHDSWPAFRKRAYERNCERDHARDYPADAPLARHLIDWLIEREVDVGSALSLPQGTGEGHALAFVHKRIMTRSVVPVVPVLVNTYYPPNQPTPRRCYRLGQQFAAAVAAYPGDARVGILASGGLSHFVIDEELDERVIAALRAKDAAALQALPRERLEAGSSEIRSWICVAGAVEHLALDWLEYVPCYRTAAGTGTAMCFASWA